MTIKSRKRLHGKKRRKSSLKQRISDTNPYGNIPVPVIAKPNTSNTPSTITSPPTSVKPDAKKVALEFAKKSIKKQIVKKVGGKVPVIKNALRRYGGKALGRLGGVASLMFDALPAGKGSTTMDNQFYDDLWKKSSQYQNQEIKDTLANIRKKNNN